MDILLLVLGTLLFVAAIFNTVGMIVGGKDRSRRRELYNYLKGEKLPPSRRSWYRHWEICGVDLTDSGEDWYAFKDGELFICSFTGDIIDYYRYKKIHALMKAAP